jgi:hypothetical protein
MKKLLAVGLLAVGLLWGVSAFAQLSQTDSVEVFFDIAEYLMFSFDVAEVDLGTITAPDTAISGNTYYTLVTNAALWDLQLTSVSIITDPSTHPSEDVTYVIRTRHTDGGGFAFLNTAPFYYLQNQLADASSAVGPNDYLMWEAIIDADDFNYYPSGAANVYRVECVVTASTHT